MTSWVLRTPDGEIAIERECTIGRGSDCEVALDDGNASRRHATVRVDGTSVIVEDLHSRNGTFVDGRLIGSPTRVGDGARIIIGHTVLTLIASADASSRPRASRPPLGPYVPDAVHTNTDVPDRAMLARAVAMLAAGRIDECAGGASIVMRRQSALGPKAPDEFVRGVSSLLVTLAVRTRDPRWLAGVFQVNTDCERMLAPDLVDAIEGLAQPGTLGLLPGYVDKMSALAGSLSNAERVLLARLERLTG